MTWRLGYGKSCMAKTTCALLVLVVLSRLILAVGAGTLLAADGGWDRRPAGQELPRAGLSTSAGSRSSPAGCCSCLGADHRLGQHRLPGTEAELPALEPDRLRQLSWRRSCSLWLIPVLLDRLPLAGDRLRRAAGDLHRSAQQAGGQQPAGAHARAPPLLVRHEAEQVGDEDSRPKGAIRTSRACR